MKSIFYIFFWFPVLICGQAFPIENDSISDKLLIIVGDTIRDKSIVLNEVYILPKLKIESYKARRRYLILQRKTIKVYPYAKLASERLESLNDRLSNLKRPRKRKKYTRLIQKFIEDEFAEKLKKLTKTEGQILIKLIHRQTGETAFDLIKSLRSGWRAFWYNNTAQLFDMSLKIPFDPWTSEEDYLIEDILQRQFQNGRLEYQKSFKNFNLYKLSKEWNP